MWVCGQKRKSQMAYYPEFNGLKYSDERYIYFRTVLLDFHAAVGTVHWTLVRNTLNKTNQTPAINWRNKKFKEYKARNWGSLSRKRKLSVNPNLRITYPTFGLIVETRHELKIQVFGSFSGEMSSMIEQSRGYIDKYFNVPLWTNKAIRIERKWWFVDSQCSIIIWTNKFTTGLA